MRITSILLLSVVLLAASNAIPPGQDFGAGLSLKQPTALAEVVKSPEKFASEPVLLRGRVSDVCQRKGCWTILRDGQAHVRVRFKDYGFFLPKDSAGQEAFVEGIVNVVTLSEKEARHYEEESRSGDPESVRGPRREIGFTASGVRLLPRD